MQVDISTTEEPDVQSTMKEIILAEGRSDKSCYTTGIYSEGYVEAANDNIFRFRNTFDAYNRKNHYKSHIISENSFSAKDAVYTLINNFYADTSKIVYEKDKMEHRRYAVIKPEMISLIMGYTSKETNEDIYDMFIDSDYYGVFVCIDINRKLFIDSRWKDEMKNIAINSKTYGESGVYKSIVLKDIFRKGSNLDFKVEHEE